MHLLDTLQKLLQWSIDHSDKLFYVAKTFFLVRNESTKKTTKTEEKAPPTQETALSDKDGSQP